MTALSTLVPALKRELAVPGTFDDVFPDTSTADLIGALADGFAEAQLFGFFKDVTLTAEEGPPLDWTVSPDLSPSGGALVVIYTSIRSIRAQIRALNTLSRYKAGPVEFETGRAATVLKAELDFLFKRLDDILDNANGAARASAGMATVFDNYLSRTAASLCWSGFYPYEWK